MCMKVIWNLTHHPVKGPTTFTESLISSMAEMVEHVLEVCFGRIDSVLAPNDHRCVTNLAVGDPANLVVEVPFGQLGRFAQLADLARHHLRFTVTVDPAATVDPRPGRVEITRPDVGPVPNFA